MATVVNMPAVIAGESEATLLSWLVSPGDTVTAGQPYAEVETEKATVELEAEIDGTMACQLVKAGSAVQVGVPMGVISAPGDSEQDIESVLAGAGVSGPPPADTSATADGATGGVSDDRGAVAGAVAERGETSAPSEGSSNGASAGIGTERLFASPLARKLAKAMELDLSTVDGSGPGGRIIRSDVERARNAAAPRAQAIGAAPAPAAPAPDLAGATPGPRAAAPTSSAAEFEDVSLNGMRKAIARRLSESKSTVPHFYVTGDVRMDALLDLRKQVNAQLATQGIQVTVNDLVLKALGKALEATPDANVQWAGDSIRRFHRVDVAVAVATDGGLLTPVVQDVAGRSISSLAATTVDYKERAAVGKIRQNELEGGTFSLSNLGMFGVRDFSAIINPPHAGILAVGSAERRAIVVDGDIAPATVMTCTLSADHRAVDGAVAAQLLNSFRLFIETPLALLT